MEEVDVRGAFLKNGASGGGSFTMRGITATPDSLREEDDEVHPVPWSAQMMKVMLSGRFGRGRQAKKEDFLRAVGGFLEKRGVHVLVVEADATGDFGPMTIKCLAEMDVMVAFCYEDYGEKTGSSFCSYYELEFVSQHKTPCIPLKLYDGPWPPAPVHWDWENDRPGEPDEAGTNQNKFYFKPSKVYLEPDPSNPEACAEMLLEKLKKLPGTSRSSNHDLLSGLAITTSQQQYTSTKGYRP